MKIFTRLSLLLVLVTFIVFLSSFSVIGNELPVTVVVEGVKDVGHQIHLDLQPRPIDEINVYIATPSETFRYRGNWTVQQTFVLREPGIHTVSVQQDGVLIGETTIEVINASPIAVPTEPISPELPREETENFSIRVNDAEPDFNESILILANFSAEARLFIQTPTREFRFMGGSDFPVEFTPTEVGLHTVELRDLTGNVIASTQFTVLAPREPHTLPGSDDSKGSNSSSANMTNETHPPHTTPLSNTTDSEEQPAFVLLDLMQEEDPPNPPEPSIPVEIEVKDRKAQPLWSHVEAVGERQEPGEPSLLQRFGILAPEPVRQDLALEPMDHAVERLEMRSLSLEDVATIGLDKVPTKNAQFSGKETKRAFAIDLGGADFTTATATVTAIGRELWKCAQWDFATATCQGSWVKVQDLVPGQEYAIELFPGDPGYAETGVATVNVKKPIYYPGETAELIIVALDTTGHLVSGATVTLGVTSPNASVTYTSTVNGTITETSRGIYETTYPTVVEGNHTLFVTIEGRGVNSTMLSHFLVQNSYPFEIKRSSPATTDPFVGPFTTTVTIEDLSNAGNFTYVEVVPSNFTLVETGSAIISVTGRGRELIWPGLTNGSTVNYTAQPPLITPDLYALRGEIQYGLGSVFAEARPWWLAIDPEAGYATLGSGDIDMCPLGEERFAIGWCQNAADPNDLCRLAVYNTNGSLIDDIDVETSSAIYSRIAVACINSSDILVGHVDAAPEVLQVARFQLQGSTLALVDGFDSVDTDYADNNEDEFDIAATVLDGTYGWLAGTDNEDEDFDHNRVTLSDLTLSSDYQADGRTDSDTAWDNNADVCAISSTRVMGCWFDDRAGNFFRGIVFDETGTVQVSLHNIDGEIGADGAISCDCMRDDRVAFGYYDSGNSNVYIRVGDYTGDTATDVSGAVSIDANAGTSERVAVAEIEHDGQSYFGIVFSDSNAGDIKAAVYDINGTQVTAPFTVTSDENTNEVYRMVDIVGTDSNLGLNICNDTFVVAYTKSDGQSYWQSFWINGTVWDGVCSVAAVPDVVNVSLVSPPDNTIDGDGDIVFRCNATDTTDLVNLTLYTNISGILAPNQTANFTGSNDTFGDANFTINGLSDGLEIEWNCLATNSENTTAFASQNWTVNVSYLPEQPNVTLDSPGDNTTAYVEPVTFNCSATDNNDIASLNLYIDRGAGLNFEQTRQFTGSSDSDVSASFDASGFTDDQTIYWNCKAIDNNSNEVFYSSNYTLHIQFLEPNVTLLSPSDYGYDLDGTVNMSCNVQDNSDIVNVTFYTNHLGSWQAVNTTTLGGASDNNTNVSYVVTGVSYGTEFQWNCFTYDDDGFTAWAPANYTVTIPPLGTNYFAPDGGSGGTWNNPNRADEEADGQTANADLDDQLNLYTFNYSAIPVAGTLLEAYLSLRWSLSTPPVNDYLGMQYSPDGATNYYSLAGTLNGYTQPSSYPSSQTNQSYLISGSINLTQLTSLYYRLTGFKVTSRDYSSAQVDALWLTARISPPPQYTSYGKNQTVIYENDTVTFWAAWTDDINLDCHTFSINQNGTWWNGSCTNLQGKSDNGTYSIQITAAPSTTVYWRFYAQDNFGDTNVTPIQSFIVADANDTIPPYITNLSASPDPGPALTQFNLSADITDNIGIFNATVEVTPPGGSAQNYSMTRGTGNRWWTLYQGLQGGVYTFRVFAADGNWNSNVSGYNQTFNVTPYVLTNKEYYDRSEVAIITGYGFTKSQNMTYHVENATGASQTGFPKTVTADTTGNASTTWNIPTGLTFPLGAYTVLGNDTTSGSTNATDILVVAKPDVATKTDDVSTGDDVKVFVNESDNSTTTLVGDAAETYVELRYQDLVFAGYAMSTLYLYVEHQDLDPESDTIDIQYYNGATWAAATCGSLAFSATETMDSCALTADLASIPDKNDIRLRLSDGNGGNDGVNFAKIDFAFLLFNFTISSSLSVNIDEPTNLQSLYDFTDTASNTAYDGPVTALPPATQTTGTVANSTEYTYLDTSDNIRWQTIVTSAGQYVSQSYYFTIAENEADVVQLTITHDGYATKKTSLDADSYRIYLWNYDTSAYDVVSADPIAASGSDQTIEIEITAGITSYIDTGGEVNVFIEGDYILAGCGSPANCRADLYTDYIGLEVERIRTIGGFQDINVTAVDGDGVQSCSYVYSQGATTYTTYGMTNVTPVIWYNSSDTTAYTDGIYNITANCTDGSEINDTEYITVRVLNVAPNVSLVAPANNTNFTTSSVNFTWNASSDAGNPLCDLFIDGSEEVANIVSTSGQNTTQQVDDIPDGKHAWYVRCNVGGGAYNTTVTRNFTTDTTGPTIVLNDPANQTVSNLTIVTFNYTPSDNNSIDNCSLYIDGSVNQSNASISNGQPNVFTTPVSEGDHTWFVACEDEFGFTGTSGIYDLTIDNTKPTISLSNPVPEQVFLGGLVQFNYTVTDNQDTSLVCNITVDGVVEDANIPSANNTPIIRNLVIGDGFKEWNVTCVDNAGNYNTSETRNFTVQGPPTVTLIDPTNDEWIPYTGIDFIYYVEDGQGINNCSLYLDGAYNQTNSSVNNSANNNFSETMAQGHHNWTVECFDTDDKSTMHAWWNFTVDTTPPNITLYGPANDTIQEDANVTFSFNVTDNLDASLVCNITVNGVVNVSNRDFSATSGANTSRYEGGIENGDIYWNVTCVDDAGWSYTSETRYFFMGSEPDVVLISPENNTQESSNVVFYYTPTDNVPIENCSLYLNGVWNDSEIVIATNATNNFTVVFSSEQHVSWYVNCSNEDGNPGFSPPYELDIDLTPPNITLNYPDGDVISTTNVTFNFTAYDNNASQLSCDLYINGSLNKSGITADNGVPETVLVTGFSSGFYEWNVTCTDNASLSNWSTTNNFTISFGPAVSLQFPADDAVTNATDVLFNYTVSSPTALENCSLLFNGTINQTKNASEIPHVGDGQLNNFTVTNIGEGIYNWTVQCYDTNDVSSLLDEYRIVHIDRAAPNITLNYPENDGTVSLSFVDFNFTAYDAVDDELLCNLTVYYNGTLNKSATNITAAQGVPTIHQLTGFTSGTYDWNVTCTDGLYTNTSATQNFTISNIPQVLLQNPYDGYSDPDGYIDFTYIPQTIAAGGWQYCQFIVDGVVNDTDVVVQNGVINTFNYTNLTNGNHTWQVNCTDQDNFNATGGPRNFSIDLVDPNVTANAPLGTVENSTVTFNFTAYDNLDGSLDCSIYINGTNYATTWALNATPRLYNITGLTDSYFTYYINCSDEAGRYNTSTTENFTVAEPPNIALGNPANQSRTTDVNWTLYYTPTDNSGSLENCSLYINGAWNQSNTTPVSEGSQNNFTLSDVPHGTYNWSVSCTDPSSYVGNSSQKVFYVDLLSPTLNLTYPSEGQVFNQDDITFNWTAIDFPDSTVTCDLYIDGAENVSNLTRTSPGYFNTTVYNLSDGPHNWTVNCTDDLGTWNWSETRNFSVNQPDLYLNNSRVGVNNTNPNLLENITIYANVTNIGGRDVSNVLVEFWDGPVGVGTLIGNDTANVNVNQSVIFSVPWNITAGYHTIHIAADPYNAIGEMNESNNNATYNISPLWVNVSYPLSDSYTNNENTSVNFTPHDHTGGAIDYTIYVDGVANASGTTTDNTVSLDNVTLVEGNRSIIIQINDVLGRYRNSSVIYRIYDATPPGVNFETLNNTFFNDTTPPISFNFTDALSTLINYTVFVDGTPDGSNSTFVDTSVTFNLTALGEGEHNVTVQGTDQAGNVQNETIIIYVDLVAPSIQLNYPPTGTNFTTTNVQLNFTATDNVDPLLQCNLTLDGSVVRDNINASNGSIHPANLTGLSEGPHYWNVTCWDGNNEVYQVLHQNTSETRSFNIFIPPNVTLLSPPDENVTNVENITFYFNVSDDTGLENCSIYLNGVWNQSKNSSELTINATNNFTVNNLYGYYEWNVTCWDNASISTQGWSQTWNITVDTIAPYPYFETANESWFNTATPLIWFNITDDFADPIDYNIYANGAFNTNGSVPNGTSSSTNLAALVNGTHVLLLEGVDVPGNSRNSSPITIYIDTVEPNIQLHDPASGGLTDNATVTFNFTPTDNMDTVLNCTLEVSGETPVNLSVPNGTWRNHTIADLAYGIHYWNVTCVDEAGNTNTSLTWNFTVPIPDLTITAGNISFSNATPIEGDNVTVNATIFNIGNSTATNFIVQFFFGDPALGGTQIGSNSTVVSLAPGANTTLQVNYTTVIGQNDIYVIVDAPLATNGTVPETDETNNKAYKGFYVGLYTYFSGTTNNTLRVTDSVLLPVWVWNMSNATGSNILVADIDSNIGFTTLQALGRNTTDAIEFDDFAELDTQLSSTNYADNINITWTSSGAPRETRQYTLFSQAIPNVPIVNSTNVTAFKTGILWDTSDGGSGYNGTQDVVFVTQINESKAGSRGTYDYEARVPAPLRQYTGATAAVIFYVELR